MYPRTDRSLFYRLLIGLMLPAFLVMYTETMVSPSLREFMHVFHVSEADVAWILTAYLLSGVATTPIFGKIAPRLGYRRTLVIILLLYSAALTFCSTAQSFESMILSRAIQGVGMAMFPVAFAVVRELLPPEQVVFLQGILSAMFGVGAVFGLVVGSHIAEIYGWRALFRSASIIAWAIAFTELALLPEIRRDIKVELDAVGILLFSSSTTLLCFAFERAAHVGWTSTQVLVPVGVGILTMVAFIYWELAEREPFIDVRKLSETNILVSNLAGILAGFAMFIFFQIAPIHMTIPKPAGFGLTIEEVGTYMTIPALSMMASSAIFSKIAPKIGIKRLFILSGIAGIITSLVFLVVNLSSLTQFILACALEMSAVGLILVSLINLLVLSVRREEVALMTSINMVFRYVGGSIGTAFAGYLQDAIRETILIQTPLGPLPLSVPSPDSIRVAMLTVACMCGLIALIGLKAREVLKM